MSTPRLISSLLFAALLSVPARGMPDTDRESWYVVRIGGATVGTASESVAETPSGIVFRAHMNVSFARLGTPLSMMVLSEEMTDPDGRLVRSRMESSLSNSSSTASMDGDTLRYESRVGGAVHRRSLVWNPDAVTEVVAARRLRGWVVDAATPPETTMTIFDISEGDFRVQRFVRVDEASGIDQPDSGLIFVDEYDTGSPTPSSSIWFDGDGDVVRTVVRQLGVEIMIERVAAEAVNDIVLEPDFDIVRQSMVRCDGFPRPAGRVKDVTLRLEFPGAPPTAPMSGPNQEEVAREARRVDVRLTRETSLRMTEDPESLERFLRPDRFVQSGDPVVRAVADSIRSETRARGWDLARVITDWVNGHIVHKGMQHGYASALDVYRTRAGDCTEHSLLAVAVLRAAGIPARPVVGLAYGEEERAFVGHMWVEAYVDYWRTLDPLDLALDPIRLRVHASESSESPGERDLLRAYGAVAGVTLRAIDYHLE